MNRPLTILGAERRLFFVALITGAALFNLLHSLLGGLTLFVVRLVAAQWATKYDPQILRILFNSSKFKAFYDPAKYEPEKSSVLTYVSTRVHSQTI
jgi:type IV secretory pathway TrbD component